ncbi:molybdate ABC transporter substrate-binding protein [Desulfogranum japonicum]|uniref:molybdate ABC transporter substrate-binding protein n=1 Tax=Desulfogranum japonicum TaxID=231447 RepID=UPI0003FC2AB9|nr:molybdate ABC transporter substrate-binding protein [Desulfogranum japonicum]
MKRFFLSIVLAFFTFTGSALAADTVYLSVAASMTDAFNELISTFKTEHPDATLLPNYASSGSLAKQIDQGAPADLYVSANPKWMKFLKEKNMIAANTDRIFAFNKLVFVGEPNISIDSMEALATLKRIAIGTPESVPAGQYAKQAMEAAHVFAPLQENNKLMLAKDVRQALLYADRGEVDGAFVYRTDALLAQHAKIVFTVPDQLYDKVAYPMGLTVSGAGKATAQAFLTFMQSDQATNILKKYGFQPAE